MKLLLFSLAAWSALGSALLGEVAPRTEPGNFIGRSDLFSKLAPQLSSNASIILPTDPLFVTHQRWQALSAPTYAAVVEVTCHDDVLK